MTYSNFGTFFLTQGFLSFLIAFFAVSLCTLTVILVQQYPSLSNPTTIHPTRRLLSEQLFYTESFAKSPNQTIFEAQQAIHRLNRLVSSALATKPSRLQYVWPQKGYTFDKQFMNADYTLLSGLVNELCEPTFINIPRSAPSLVPMCLSVFTNAFIGPSGVIYDSQSNVVYDAAGGCCVFDWKRHTDGAIDLRFAPKRMPIVLALGFHHAVTYHHVVHEFLARLLPLLPLLDAEPDIYLAIDESMVASRFLDLMGVERSRIVTINRERETWVHGAIVLQPPPLSKCRYEWNCIEKYTKTTAKVLRDAALQSISFEESKKVRPKLLLMERARTRKSDGSCGQQRCAKNFEELRTAIKEEFGRNFEIEVVPHELSVIDTVRTFIDAAVVVGLHGAGFQNMMYCPKGTTIVHIGWDRQYENLAEEFGMNYHLSYMKTMTRNSKNLIVDVKKIVADVERAINEDRVVSNT